MMYQLEAGNEVAVLPQRAKTVRIVDGFSVGRGRRRYGLVG
jgi:hypothetical protein